MNCRICGSELVIRAGDVEFFTGYAVSVFDCGDCRCRFTRYEASAYERLYAEPNSCYSRYIDQAERCKTFFDRGDLCGLRAELSATTKYRLIMEAIDREPPGSRLLEFGCSRGHLTSYFILAGYTITGADLSKKAVQAASQAFGDHFVMEADPTIEANAPYDAIFHVGTIGCVADPLGLTRRLLRLLKPGGRLLFNVPNRAACYLDGQLWIDTAPPPDVVTLFPPGFWRSRLADAADVHEEEEVCQADRALFIGAQKLAQLHWCRPAPIPLSEGQRLPTRPPAFGDALWRLLGRLLRRFARSPALSRFAPRYPTEFGLFVRIAKRQAGAGHLVREERDCHAVVAAG